MSRDATSTPVPAPVRGEAISVVLATYDGARHLRQTLESVLAQRRRPDEIVIVDDCSTDGTATLATTVLADRGIPFRIASTVCNSGGPATPLTLGVAAATGPWIALLDQDDLWDPSRLEVLAAHAAHSPRCALLFGEVLRLGPDDRLAPIDATCAGRVPGGPGADAPRTLVPASATGAPARLREIPGALAYAQLLLGPNFVHTASNMFFAKARWAQAGGFDARHRICWDVEFLLRLAATGPFGFFPAPLATHRAHAASLSADASRSEDELTAIRTAHLAGPLSVDDRRRLRAALAGAWAGRGYRASRAGDARTAARALHRSLRLGWPLHRVVAAALKAPAHLALAWWRRHQGAEAALTSNACTIASPNSPAPECTRYRRRRRGS